MNAYYPGDLVQIVMWPEQPIVLVLKREEDADMGYILSVLGVRIKDPSAQIFYALASHTKLIQAR